MELSAEDSIIVGNSSNHLSESTTVSLPTTEEPDDDSNNNNNNNINLVLQKQESVEHHITIEKNDTTTATTTSVDNQVSVSSSQNVDENPTTFDSIIVESSVSGVKRPRLTFDEQKPLVRVIYDSITRESKRKLEELLTKWSEWHAQHCSSTPDHHELLESGEDTYYPALNVGVDKPAAVPFWMDKQIRNQQNKELIPMDCDSAPHYDRGYALGLTSFDGSNNLERSVDLIDASRCFNCGSYNHSLKECPKPRNNAAVNNARKQQKSRRNQNAGNRNPSRYYHSSSGGKYDDLRPGALDSETKKLLGIGELDPPPWLNRMREIGYPHGYLDPDDEDQPSGINIFGEEDDCKKIEQEDGEILDTEQVERAITPKLKMKMGVEFPGINAPFPENADQRHWAAGTSSSEQHWNRSHRRSNHSSDPYRREQNRQQRWSQDLRDDGPPGCDSGIAPFSSYPSSYRNYDTSYSRQTSRTDIERPRSPSFVRSNSDRSSRNPLDREDFRGHDYFMSNRSSVEWSRYEPDAYQSSYSSSHKYHDSR